MTKKLITKQQITKSKNKKKYSENIINRNNKHNQKINNRTKDNQK